MLTIRRHQMQLLEVAGLRRFEQDATHDLRKSFPEECAAYSDAELLDRVHRWVAQARSHRILTEAGMTVWLHISLVLLDGFDADPDPTWAAGVLADTESATETVRVRRLLDTALSLLDDGRAAPPARA